MLDRIGWTHLVHLRYPTYVRLKLEFLSSHFYVTNPMSHNSTGTVRFRMFNMDYEFNHDQIIALL